MDNRVEFQEVAACMYLDIREESPASRLLLSYIPECLTYGKRDTNIHYLLLGKNASSSR